MGDPEEDGSVRMFPLTHALLSEDIGTTREIVSKYMNQFRKQGYLQYSRKGIVLHRDAFHNWLRTASPKPAKFRTLMSPGHWETAKLEKCVWVAGSENHIFRIRISRDRG